MTATMDAAALPKIRSLRIRPRHRVEVQLDDNAPMTIDMSDLIVAGTAFGPLKDMDLFSTARIGERRRTIEWPDPINANAILVDYCADALVERAKRQQVGLELGKLLQLVRNLRDKIIHPSTKSS
jgi:hypothetical protein